MASSWSFLRHDDDRCDKCNERTVEVTKEGYWLCRKHLDEYNKEIVQSTLERFT